MPSDDAVGNEAMEISEHEVTNGLGLRTTRVVGHITS